MRILLLLAFLAFDCSACELLVKAVTPAPVATLSTNEDLAARTRKGMVVVVMPDGHAWGTKETLPLFTIIKIPGIAPSRAMKYIQAQLDANGETIRARLWQIRWDDLPAAARTKLAAGGMTIKAGDYAGTYDYTWAQVKGFFRNLETGLDETADL